MVDLTQKISELPEITYPNENFSLPIATNTETSGETYRTTLNEIRSVLLFEDAYSTIADGLAATNKNDKFFVYTDTTKEFVNGWVNMGNSATALVDNTGTQITWGTIYSIKKGGGPTVAQWIYNGGYAKGGETTLSPTVSSGLSIVEVYINGDRQFKDQGFTVDSSNVITLAGELDKNDLVVVIMSSSDVTLEDLNTSLLSTLSGSSGAGQIGITGGGTVQEAIDGLGIYFPSVQDFFLSKNNYSTIRTRGFYTENDGGAGVWKSTGNIDTTLAGTHVPEKAKIYNASGIEYELIISSDLINVKSNGAKEVSGNTALTTDDFLCLGDVFEGIMSIYGYPANDEGYSVSKYGYSYRKLEVFIPGEYYRIGKQSIKLRSGVSIDSAGALITLAPHSDYTYAKTGKRIDGISTKENAVYWRANTNSWDLMSWNNTRVKNITLIGDHQPSLTRGACTGGVGLNIINPQHVTFENVVVHKWLMDSITREWNAHFPTEWGKVTSDMTYINQMDDDSDTQQGHFYGVTWINCEFLGSRDGCFMNLCDWGTMIGGATLNLYNWAQGVDATKPLYTVWQTGGHWTLQGGQIGVYHDDTGSSNALYPYTFAPKNATIFDVGRQSEWGNNYSEWNENYLELGALGSTYTSSKDTTNKLGNIQRYGGLHIAFDVAYKPTSKATLLKFSKEMFGSFSGSDDAGWTWTDGNTFTRGDIPRALAQYTIGNPIPDNAAFLHGGYDFKYGTYNVGFYNGVTPDVDSLRGTRDKEFLNDLGLIHNGGTLTFPVANPAYDSNIVIWFKDLTGNFDVTKITMNGYSYVDPETMTILYASIANNLIDYGNGWKAAVIRNLRPFGYSEERGWSPQNQLMITNTNETPIILKAIRAYQGGVPIYPQALETYVPQTQNNGVFGTQGSLTGCDIYPNTLGGGMFQVGDVLDGWSYLKHNTRFNFGQDWGTYGYPLSRRVVSAVGGPGPIYTSSTLSASIVSQGTSSTVVQFSSTDVLKVFLGMPIYISASTGTLTAGTYHLENRLSNTDGTLTNQYTISGVIGIVGDTLTIDNSKLSYDFQPLQVPNLQTTSWVNIGGSTTMQGYVTMRSGGASSGTFRGATTATYDLGSSGFTWNNLYLQNAPTTVSDETLKDDIQELTDTEIACAIACGKLYRRYKLKTAIEEKGEDNARYHIGTIAQYIVQCFTDHNLDWTKYGIITYESWEATEAVTDEDGNLVTPAQSGGEIYMVRYDELNSFINAGQGARLDKLEALMNYGS